MTDNTKPGDTTVGGRTTMVADLAEEIAAERCEYGDDCPTVGVRHGLCLPCKFRDALRYDAAHPLPDSRGIREGLERAATWHDSIASNPNAQALEAMTHKASAIYLRAAASKMEGR